MKKVVLLLIAICFATFFSFGNNKKIPYAEIKSMITRSVELSCVKNPNLIYVNQPLFFEYTSGYQTGVIVKEKETMSSIALSLLEKGDPGLVSLAVVEKPYSTEKDAKKEISGDTLFLKIMIPLLVAAIVMIFSIYYPKTRVYLRKKSNK